MRVALAVGGCTDGVLGLAAVAHRGQRHVACPMRLQGGTMERRRFAAAAAGRRDHMAGGSTCGGRNG